MASAWATLMHTGEEGYVRSVEVVQDLFDYVMAEIPKIQGLRMVCAPDAAIS
jgi:glutamate/tyrosine decarboxylase-like PLP-dependent enzyme